MIQIKCDRCEGIIPKDSPENELAFTGVHKTRFGYDNKLNLCDECLENFRNWLENKEK